MDTKSPAGLSEAEEDCFTALMDEARRGGYVIGRPVAVPKRVVRPDLTYEQAEPGLEFPPLEYRVSAEAVARFSTLVERVLPGGSLVKAGEVPPSLFADEPMQCIATSFGRSGRLHLSHRMETLRPIPVGSLVRSRGRFSDRYEKSKRKFIEVECTIFIVEGPREIPAIKVWATLLP